MENGLSEKLLKLIDESNEPLQTSELVKRTGATRAKVMYRLGCLRGDRKIMGKQVGASKKCWIWWKLNSVKK